eukprot:11155986-Ditylum_brightwellii.AAC.1
MPSQIGRLCLSAMLKSQNAHSPPPAHDPTDWTNPIFSGSCHSITDIGLHLMEDALNSPISSAHYLLCPGQPHLSLIHI